MAWIDGRMVGAGVLALALGCTAANPAFDDSGGETGAVGETTTDGVDGTTTDPSTAPPPVDSSGGEGGDLVCDVPPEGGPVLVEPTAGVSADLCGASLSGTGVLDFNGSTYNLYSDPNCQRGEPMAMTFYPNGPAWSIGASFCIDYEIHYRPDCSFEWAVLNVVGEGDPFFIAATIPASPSRFLELGRVPKEAICDCMQARADQCCADTPAPGVYAMTVVTDGETLSVPQGSQTTFPLSGHNYELQVEQARVLPGPECDARVGFQWLFRRVTMG